MEDINAEYIAGITRGRRERDTKSIHPGTESMRAESTRRRRQSGSGSGTSNAIRSVQDVINLDLNLPMCKRTETHPMNKQRQRKDQHTLLQLYSHKDSEPQHVHSINQSTISHRQNLPVMFQTVGADHYPLSPIPSLLPPSRITTSSPLAPVIAS